MVKAMVAIRPVIVSLFLFGFLILSSCSTFQKTQQEKHQTLFVTATAFNSLPKQGQGNPNVGAWGDRLTPGMSAVAVSPDLETNGLRRGTRIKIEGRPNDYVVWDRMPARWKRRIDIYMGNDVKAARAWGVRQVNIYWTASDQ